ncbi:MAG: GH116 family glycosyl hydrolase [bacterium]
MLTCKRMVIFSLLFSIGFFCSCARDARIRVGYIVFGDASIREDGAILDWLESHERFVPRRVELKGDRFNRRGIDVFWLNIPDSSAYAHWLAEPEYEQNLKSLLKKKSRWLLTNYAALLPHALGIESEQPEVHRIQIKDDWLFDQKGFQGWRDHPVFAGLFGGAFVWDGYKDHVLDCIGFYNDHFPAEGKVVGVEKSYITVHRENRLLLEYKTKKWRVLSVGAFIRFGQRNRLAQNLRQFIENSLFYLRGEKSGLQPTYWKSYSYRPKSFEVSTKPIYYTLRRKWNRMPESQLVIANEKPQNQFFDVAGRRVLVMGKENGGIDEVWVHPFRILRDYEVGMVAEDSIAWLSRLPVRTEIRPESFTRYYRTDEGEIKEIIFPSMDRAGALVHYKADRDVRLVIRVRSDLRWMWPYDEYALGDVHYGYDERLHALHVRDETGDFACIFGGDIAPDEHIEGAFERVDWEQNTLRGRPAELNQVYHGVVYSLNTSNGFCVNIALVGTDQGMGEALSDYSRIIGKPYEVYAETVDHYRRLLDRSVTIEGPDEEFNRLWKWALVGTDRFFVRTPDLGSAFVAGYATTARGWDGGQKISGRPGYGWYFGRDAAWSGFAVDDYGDCEAVKEQLRFFQKFQDGSGKIFHELSTSGVVHYDAADATPLYVILAGHYLRASGDLPFIRESWPCLKWAMDFLYSTDTDGDGLIENTNVGHGWVEGGSLWGAHTTFYLAGLWAQALKEAAYIASHVDETDLADAYSREAVKVERILNTDFWNASENFYYYGKLANGSYNAEKTVLPAVAMGFHLLDDEKASQVLYRYAGNGFSSDWGVRILSSESPLFNPRGYHYGSVWPLYTGWTALAEYAYGNSTQGFMHINNNLLIKNHWASGFTEEVMNGAVYEPSGVCPHQCWSETNIIHPAIEGMVGWKPSALENTAQLKPRFPIHWKWATVKNLRMGDSRVALNVVRSLNETHYKLTLQDGKAMTIQFYPRIPSGMIVDSLFVDGQPYSGSFEVQNETLKEFIALELKGTHSIVLKHRKGVAMVPIVPRPNPGDASRGLRIVRSRLDGNNYVVELEGRQSSEGDFELKMFDQKIASIKGGRVLHISSGGHATFRVRFPYSKKPFVRRQVRIALTTTN